MHKLMGRKCRAFRNFLKGSHGKNFLKLLLRLRILLLGWNGELAESISTR